METTYITDPQLEVRTAGQHRLLSVRCIPYGTVTHKAGRTPERFRAHAFATAPASAGKIRLRDADHAKDRISVGVATQLEDRDDGLYGVFRFYDTQEGRSALENVLADVYQGVSVGFYAQDEAEVDGIREVRAAQLHHVSLAEDPAYDDARILAVRSADRYAAALRKPDLSLLDTPEPGSMMLLVHQALGTARIRS